MDIVAALGLYVGLSYLIRKILEVPSRDPEWDKVMQFVWLGALVWYLLAQVPFLRFLQHQTDTVFYVYLLVTFYRLRDHRITKLLSMAVVPHIAVHLASASIRMMFPGWFENFNYQIESAEEFSSLWMFGFGIYALVQNNKERKIRRQEEERLRIAEEKRNQLEHLVAERTEALMQQKNELEKALEDLKAAQAQLIQSEKMASLGELTAGIAHEIQNPLNFVNNFSELSVELAQELKEALEKPEPNKELVSDLVGDLVQNQEKINHHGKRAANIVSGMLQHSRAGSGKKEPVDINDLADEYLRLSYHGLRAKNKEFNAKMSTDFDKSIGVLEVVPQDMGRVLLNLINNAFYAVTQRKTASKITAGETYEPLVKVSSHKTADGMVEICVADNGTGIPPAVAAKIFQPFFTTKPTGQGTGLGLSLAYDIVTKGHGGTLDVQSVEGEGTTFTIRIPIKS